MEKQPFVGKVVKLAESLSLALALDTENVELLLVSTCRSNVFPDEFTFRIALFHDLNARTDTLVHIVNRVEFFLPPNSA